MWLESSNLSKPFSVKYCPVIKFIKSFNAVCSCHYSDDTNDADGCAELEEEIAYYAWAHKFIDILKTSFAFILDVVVVFVCNALLVKI